MFITLMIKFAVGQFGALFQCSIILTPVILLFFNVFISKNNCKFFHRHKSEHFISTHQRKMLRSKASAAFKTVIFLITKQQQQQQQKQTNKTKRDKC